MAQRGKRMDERTNGKSPHLKDFVPYRATALPPPMKTKEKVEQGKGTTDHLMPLGYFIKNSFNFFFFQWLGDRLCFIF